MVAEINISKSQAVRFFLVQICTAVIHFLVFFVKVLQLQL